MTRGVRYVMAGALLLATAGFAEAQHAGAPPGAQPAPPMEMCRQMMGEHGGMTGMAPMTGGDAKQQADMMAMRGEMMKEMGDIMTKYAQRMQPAK